VRHQHERANRPLGELAAPLLHDLEDRFPQAVVEAQQAGAGEVRASIQGLLGLLLGASGVEILEIFVGQRVVGRRVVSHGNLQETVYPLLEKVQSPCHGGISSRRPSAPSHACPRNTIPTSPCAIRASNGTWPAWSR